MERDLSVLSSVAGLPDFNSRAHVERDLLFLYAVTKISISTHALTWSATTAQNIVTKVYAISTHALTWSATDAVQDIHDHLAISTHALTWSATQIT